MFNRFKSCISSSSEPPTWSIDLFRPATCDPQLSLGVGTGVLTAFADGDGALTPFAADVAVGTGALTPFADGIGVLAPFEDGLAGDADCPFTHGAGLPELVLLVLLLEPIIGGRGMAILGRA